MAMGLMQLIYVSTAIRELSDGELDEILESSVRHNADQAVTGMLLYAGGCFMQVLEGEETAVDETYGRICRDTRHHQIYLLAKELIAAREFPRWSMGFHRITAADAGLHPAYAPLFERGFDAASLGTRPGIALELLKEFSRN
jgi:hypothetical protein